MKDNVHRDGYIFQGLPSHYPERRRAANSASFFTPHLAPGMSVLDCGCGPGTITLDFAEIVALSVLSIRGDLQYTVLYRRKDIGEWEIHSRIPQSEFQQKFDEMKERSMAPHYVAAYRHEGEIFFSVIFASKNNGGRVTHHGMDPVEYQNTWEEHLGEGKLTQAVTGYDGAISKHRYVGIWK